MQKVIQNLPRTVIVLGFASFFTDFSSEMIYPLLPVFLSTVLGAGALQLGLIEGVAESTASLMKVVSGFWTDRLRRRKPFIVWGYSIAGLARPLIGLVSVWPVVLLLRFIDRVGKGLRTSPRDALIADVTASGIRGRAYGFHRAMDHAGAVVGPLVAAALLKLWHVPLRSIFLWAAIPAVVVLVLLASQLTETQSVAKPEAPLPFGSWKMLGRDYKFFLTSVFVFTLGGSADAFLLLRLSGVGIPVASIAVLWSLHHVIKMVSTYWGGRWADRVDRRWMILSGWIVYAGIYLGFAWTSTPGALVGLFLVYGLYYGLTEPAERALVSDLAPPGLRGTAFGFFHAAEGLGALPASALFGLIWKLYGVSAAFMTGAALALAASVLLGLRRRIIPLQPPALEPADGR